LYICIEVSPKQIKLFTAINNLSFVSQTPNLMFKYLLISSALSTEKGSCYDSVTTVENLQMEDIINQMIEEGSGLTGNSKTMKTLLMLKDIS
jgi:hypothetical protein